MKDNKLEKLRKKINTVDDQILELFSQRSKIVKEIGKNKDNKITVVDLDREEIILNRLLKKTKGDYSKDTIIRIWRELFQASSNLQVPNSSPIQTKRSIRSINVYKGGKSSIKGKRNIIKLSSNENTHGPSPKVLKNLKLHKIVNRIHRYPDIDGSTLRNRIAKLNRIDPDRIVLGCGSDEILLFAALSFCKDGDEIIQAKHGFEMYPIIAKIVGATTKYAKEDKNYKVTTKSICDQITGATKLVYLANPNNPTGNYLSRKEIVELINSIPKNVILVIDGAYAEYVIKKDFEKKFSLTDDFENIILTRTFSKSYGLAGLRIGWSYSSKKIANILNQVKGPFNTSIFSQEIALSAIEDQNYIKNIVNKNIKIKNWFENELKKMKIKTLPSFANFSFLHTTKEHAEILFNHLQKDGIIVRQLNSYGLPNCLRITIGKKDEMISTINSLKKLI